MLSEKIISNLSKSSWIRAMFEEGSKLAQKHGAESCFFSCSDPQQPLLQEQHPEESLLILFSPHTFKNFNDFL